MLAEDERVQVWLTLLESVTDWDGEAVKVCGKEKVALLGVAVPIRTAVGVRDMLGGLQVPV